MKNEPLHFKAWESQGKQDGVAKHWLVLSLFAAHRKFDFVAKCKDSQVKRKLHYPQVSY